MKRKQMRKDIIRRAVWILLTLMVMAVIFLFSAQDSQQSEGLSDRAAKVLHVEETLTPEQKQANTRISNQPLFAGLTLRKMAHMFLFFCLGFCMTEAMKGWKWRIIGAAVLSYLYAVSDEYHQQMTGRYGRWEDTLIDLAGIVIGIGTAVLIGFLWNKLRKARERRKEAV